MTLLSSPSRAAIRAYNQSLTPRYIHATVASAVGSFPSLLATEKNRFHIYLSRSRDPYLNLSIEHYIYEKSAPNSTILLLYINDPCVVIGRNQNPWLEANLQTLKQRDIPLIRRRSGGGTVFHDHGNVNFSVIYPPADFTRDKYAELITSALRTYQPRARVNERHDIVIDQGEEIAPEARPAGNDMHRTNYDSSKTKKCSGSAYKLSRNRALHHGTCLINSPNLTSISSLLRSPLEPFVKARGVDSVRSPVTNAFDHDQVNAVELFTRLATQTFIERHGLPSMEIISAKESQVTTQIREAIPGVIYGQLGADMQNLEGIKKGMLELRSEAWLWQQTPRFTFSSYPTEEDERARPELPTDLPSEAKIHFTSRAGKILSADFSTDAATEIDVGKLIDLDIHEMPSWKDALQQKGHLAFNTARTGASLTLLASWLDQLFGKSISKS